MAAAGWKGGPMLELLKEREKKNTPKGVFFQYVLQNMSILKEIWVPCV
jgi:hypothetical protein